MALLTGFRVFSWPDLTNDSSFTPCERVHDVDALPGVMLQENNILKGLNNSSDFGVLGGKGGGVMKSSLFLE